MFALQPTLTPELNSALYISYLNIDEYAEMPEAAAMTVNDFISTAEMSLLYAKENADDVNHEFNPNIYPLFLRISESEDEVCKRIVDFLAPVLANESDIEAGRYLLVFADRSNNVRVMAYSEQTGLSECIFSDPVTVIPETSTGKDGLLLALRDAKAIDSDDENGGLNIPVDPFALSAHIAGDVQNRLLQSPHFLHVTGSLNLAETPELLIHHGGIFLAALFTRVAYIIANRITVQIANKDEPNTAWIIYRGNKDNSLATIISILDPHGEVLNELPELYQNPELEMSLVEYVETYHASTFVLNNI